MIAASVYTAELHTGASGGYGHSYILAWISFVLTFLLALTYLILRKKSEWDEKEKKKTESSVAFLLSADPVWQKHPLQLGTREHLAQSQFLFLDFEELTDFKSKTDYKCAAFLFLLFQNVILNLNIHFCPFPRQI